MLQKVLVKEFYTDIKEQQNLNFSSLIKSRKSIRQYTNSKEKSEHLDTIDERETFMSKKRQSRAVNEMIQQVKQIEDKLRIAKRRNQKLKQLNKIQKEKIESEKQNFQKVMNKPMSLLKQFAQNNSSRAQLLNDSVSHQYLSVNKDIYIHDSNADLSRVVQDSSRLNPLKSSRSLLRSEQSLDTIIIRRSQFNDVQLRQTTRIAHLYEYYFTERMQNEYQMSKQKLKDLLSSQAQQNEIIEAFKNQNQQVKKIILVYSCLKQTLNCQNVAIYQCNSRVLKQFFKDSVKNQPQQCKKIFLSDGYKIKILLQSNQNYPSKILPKNQNDFLQDMFNEKQGILKVMQDEEGEPLLSVQNLNVAAYFSMILLVNNLVLIQIDEDIFTVSNFINKKVSEQRLTGQALIHKLILYTDSIYESPFYNQNLDNLLDTKKIKNFVAFEFGIDDDTDVKGGYSRVGVIQLINKLNQDKISQHDLDMIYAIKIFLATAIDSITILNYTVKVTVSVTQELNKIFKTLAERDQRRMNSKMNLDILEKNLIGMSLTLGSMIRTNVKRVEGN
ncbi:UNKNOWN [Stylonychia lemnae]|uniref:Uncharacterized protein n=1 Tax=Stylonychia lemnae TaxID=5949 RepID=A0A078B1N4_STYLE|nr:UNKNOWN [Stylonychia lemnae]|eukprot:CDW88475.1 UNKNOWN [Stylonychia lemnae]